MRRISRRRALASNGAGLTLVDDVAQRYGRLDVLVHNAGRGCVGTAETLEMGVITEQMSTNYLSVVALTKAALLHMREARSGTILAVTSMGGVVGQPFADAYCGAKFAVEGFMQSLTTVAAHFGVRVRVIEPAAVASNVQQDDDAGLYRELLDAYLERTKQAFASAQSPESAGEAIAGAALAEANRFRWQTSDASTSFAGIPLADLDGTKVFDTTRAWIGGDVSGSHPSMSETGTSGAVERSAQRPIRVRSRSV